MLASILILMPIVTPIISKVEATEPISQKEDIYDVILFAIAPSELQGDSAIHILVSKLPSHPGCHITLSRVPRAVQ